MYRVINRHCDLDETVASLADAKEFAAPTGRPNVILDTTSDASWVLGTYPNRCPQWFLTSREYANTFIKRP